MNDLPIREILSNRDAELERRRRQRMEELRTAFLDQMCEHTDNDISEFKVSGYLTLHAKMVRFETADNEQDHKRADDALVQAIIRLAALSPCGSPVRESAARLLTSFEMLPRWHA